MGEAAAGKETRAAAAAAETRLRIAFILNEFPSISETFILDQIVGLLRRGHLVDVYAQIRGDLSAAHPEVAAYNLLARTRFAHQVPHGKARRIVRGAIWTAGQLMRRPRISVRALNVWRFRTHSAPFSLLYAAAPFLDRPGDVRRYDVVHAHFGTSGLRAVQLRALGLVTAPLVTTFYGFDVTKGMTRSARSVYAPLFSEAERILAISHRMAGQLTDLGCPREKLQVHHIGVQPARWAPLKPRHGIVSGQIRVLTVARLVEKKGVAYGIRAVVEASRQFPHIDYTIVGDGPLRRDLEQLARRLPVSAGTIRFVGGQTRDHVQRLMRSSDILLQPSVTSADGDEEGTPTVLLEAMAAELPVVSTVHSAIPEQVTPGVSGFLAPERDVPALVDGLLRLMTSPELRRDFGRNGRQAILERYDIDQLNDDLVALYGDVLKWRRHSMSASIAALETP